jgi:hypothetical protein
MGKFPMQPVPEAAKHVALRIYRLVSILSIIPAFTVSERFSIEIIYVAKKHRADKNRRKWAIIIDCRADYGEESGGMICRTGGFMIVYWYSG